MKLLSCFATGQQLRVNFLVSLQACDMKCTQSDISFYNSVKAFLKSLVSFCGVTEGENGEKKMHWTKP